MLNKFPCLYHKKNPRSIVSCEVVEALSNPSDKDVFLVEAPGMPKIYLTRAQIRNIKTTEPETEVTK